MDTNPANPNLSTIGSPATYMSGRIKYTRPQGLLFSDNSGTISEGKRVPYGIEKQDFIILSDHSRSEITISQQRLEARQRMVNGTMRSYHVADKITIGVSWQRLPSRSYNRNVVFTDQGIPDMLPTDEEYTADGGVGGVELLDWYENHSGPFYVYLAYDKYNNATFKVDQKVTDESFNYLSVYNDVRLMYFSGFEYSIQKRGRTNHDLWNINLTLEEA